MATEEPLIYAEEVMKPDKPAESEAPRRVGYPLIAWLVIIAVVVFLITRPRGEDVEGGRAARNSSALIVMELQGKYIVGVTQMQLPGLDGEKLYEEAKQLNTGPLENRLAFVVLAGELVGPDEAMKKLAELRKLVEASKTKPRAELLRLLDILGELYADYSDEQWNAPSLERRERELLRDELRWFGALALAPNKGDDTTNDADRSAVLAPAQRTSIYMLLGVVSVFGLGFLGLAGFFGFILLIYYGHVRSNIHTGSAYGGVYAETFALWMLMYLVLAVGAGLLPWPHLRPLMSGVAFALSITALGWPWLRGVSWSQFRREIGLTAGKWLWEPVFGIAGYVSALPLLFVSFVFVLMLLNLANHLSGAGGETDFGPMNAPTHPIVEWVANGGWTSRLLVVLLACVAAPVFEEIMFRGVLYRHLRELTAGWRVAISVLVSGVGSGLVFAIIHPQGFLAVPLLLSLAFSFALVREWRGSLLAPMTMHALNNGAVTTLLLLAL